MANETANLNLLWAWLIVEELIRNGVKTFCVSPGSRSTPLVAAVALRSTVGKAGSVGSVVHFDERGAAFHALGHARATGLPVAVICTSGTAVANLMPAVVEASMSRTPLILLTADRPPELQNCGANQTIDQLGFFGKFVRWEVKLPCPAKAIKPEVVLTAVDQAVRYARQEPAGPVHIDCMYREPFIPDLTRKQDLSKGVGARVPDLWALMDGRPFTVPLAMETTIATDQLDSLVLTLNSAKRGVLIAGELRSPAEQEAVSTLAHALNWPALPDIASGLRLGNAGPPFVRFYDQALLSERVMKTLKPDVILQVGGAYVSKRLLQFVGSVNARHHILVTDHPLGQDPAHTVTLRIQTDIAKTCNALSGKVSRAPKSEHLDGLLACDQIIDETIDRVLPLASAGQLSEPLVARMVTRYANSDCVRADSVLFLGNSMPVRDMDMYGAANGPVLRVALNRGASGIDGNIATAAGYARALVKPVTAILGDLASLHDLNSLALLRNVTTPFVLIVINNKGGGIFSFLPVASQIDAAEKVAEEATKSAANTVRKNNMAPLHAELVDVLNAVEKAFGDSCKLPLTGESASGDYYKLPLAGKTATALTSIFESYFGTPHPYGFAHAAKLFGLAYDAPATTDQFAEAYKAALNRNGATLIEISTDRVANHRLHMQVQREIVDALEG